MKYQSIAAVSLLLFNQGCHSTTKMLTRFIHLPLNKKIPLIKPASDIKPVKSNPPVTVWIHGTRFLPSGVMESYFYSKPGLNHYTSIESYFHQREIAQTLINSNPELFPAEHFYLYGWNGKLSFKEREKASRKLYQDLKAVRATYKKTYGAEPQIRLIAHSHGGNVILLLEQVKDSTDTDFFISEAILLATPVQKQTMDYACSSLFGKVYSFYSVLDIIQVMDPQGWQQKGTQSFFSERYFPINDKIEQISIKKNNRSIMHMDFVKLNFLEQLPKLLSEINTWKVQSALGASDWAQKNKCLCIKTKKTT